MKRTLYILIVSIITSACVPRCSLAYGIRSDFFQDHRTYNWSFVFDHARDTTSVLSWGFLSSVNSTIAKQSDGPDWSQEDGRIDVSLGYRLTERLNLSTFFSQDRYSADKTRSTTSDAGITSQLSFAGINFGQTVGAKFIDNVDKTLTDPERSEQGINYSQSISLSPRIISGSETDISLSQTLLELKRIPTNRRDLSISFSSNLDPSSTVVHSGDSIRVSYKEAWEKKRFFSGTTQKKNNRDVKMSASRGISLGVTLDVDFDYFYERDRRYTVDEDSLSRFFLSSRLVADFRLKRTLWERISVEGTYRFMQSEWDYLYEEGDEKMEEGELGGRIAAGITRADSVYITTSVGVTSFFAPVSGEFNDRDMLIVLAWGEYSHIFSSFLNMRLEGGFKNFRLTYMSEQNSFDNSQDQTYFLTPSFIWVPHRKLSAKQRYSIQARYRYHDYDLTNQTGRNSIARKISSTSELAYRCNQSITLYTTYNYRYEDDGPLIWKDQWVQKIGRDQRINAISLSLDYQPAVKLTISPKYTYERRKSWNHEAEESNLQNQETIKEKRVLESRFLRSMILVSLRYLVNQENYLYLSAGRRLQEETKSGREISDHVTASVAWVF